MALTILSGIRNWVLKKLQPDEFPNLPLPEWHALNSMVKSWDDPAYKLSVRAYETMRRSDAISQPMTKYARRIGSHALTVVGSGKRRDKLQEIVDQAIGVHDALEWLAWARLEGVRFVIHRANFDKELEMFVPDFRGCGRMRWKCGGNLYWTGWAENRVGKMDEQAIGDAAEQASAKGNWWERENVTVYRPGAGDNPEGDTDLAFQVYRIIEDAELLDKALRVYRERYSLPREMLKKIIDQLRPDEFSSTMVGAARKLGNVKARSRLALANQEAIELLEPKGATWGYLTEYRNLIERRVHKLITGEDLSSGGQAAGDRGGRDQSTKQLENAVVMECKRIADTLSTDWLPWVEKLNEEFLPRLRNGEPRPYLALRPSAEARRGTVAEMVQALDRGIPMLTDIVYETLGQDRPPGQPDIFVPVPKTGADGAVPSNEGGATQRKDREQDGSGMPAEKPQDANEDLRNVKPDAEPEPGE